MITETIYVDMGGRNHPVEVELLDDATRMAYMQRYPSTIVSTDINQETLDWFVNITVDSTQYSESDVRSLLKSDMLELCAEVATTALAVENDYGRSGQDTVPSDNWMVVSK